MPEQVRPVDSSPLTSSTSSSPTIVSGTAPGTTAGTVFAGRYRLITRVGTDPAAGAEFWRAEDTVLRRDVGVTVLRRLGSEEGAEPSWGARADEMVSRALRSGSFEHRGSARLLDVLAPGGAELPRDVLGVAVTEWVPGKSLTEAVSSGLLKPMSVARAVAPLAAAAEAAHLHGLVLGIDHPQRIRVTPDGRAQLGFALPRPDSTPDDDVRGLGAVLYTLLTANWPLGRADAARAGLTAATRTGDSTTPVAPSTERPGVPVELDTLAVGTLSPVDTPGHVHTAASVHALLSEVVAEDDRVALFPPVPDGAPADPGDVWQDRDRLGRADPGRRRKLVLALTALAVAVVIVLGFVGVQVGSMFSGGGRPAIVVGDAPVQPSDTPVASGPVNSSTDGTAAVASIDVYTVAGGDKDNESRISKVIDGDLTSGWSTSRYNQQFPLFKQGIGVMCSFATAVQLSDLAITSPSDGTVVEIRQASEADTPLADTQLLSTQRLGAGSTRISLSGSQPVTHLLVWITKLGGADGANMSEIDEIQFHRASG